MCGIFGYNSKTDKKKESIFFNELKHRGPDAQKGVAVDGWYFGHLRLSIIDPSAKADQPMIFGDDLIIFNGEIYNYIELKRKYLSGIKLKTSSDTEVLLRLLSKYGLNILHELNGMFAFAWYNKKTKKLLLVRDRYGVKPLYWMLRNGNFYFASEIKPLVKMMDKVEINPKASKLFFQETVSDCLEESCIRGIKQVMPGSLISVGSGGKITKIKWYHFNDFIFNRRIFRNYQSTVDYFEELLTSAIVLRHRSDVPVAITLSGGLDSTTIYTLAKEKFNSHAQPINYTHKTQETDESELASDLAMEYSDHIVKVGTDSKQTVGGLTKILRYLEFPIWNNSATAYWDTYKKIHQLGYKVVIEGHGSDELLGGYPYMVEAAWKEYLSRRKYLVAFRLYRVYLNTLNPSLNQQLVGPVKYLPFIVNFFKGSNRNLFQTTMEIAFNRNIIPVVLRTFDRLTMAHSVESRSPFMDYRVVEFCMALPMKYKINRIGNKAILREILKKYHKENLYKKKTKMGFSADAPAFYNNKRNRSAVKQILNRFNDRTHLNIKKGALKIINSNKKISWKDVEIIWKVLSMQIIKEIYQNA